MSYVTKLEAGPINVIYIIKSNQRAEMKTMYSRFKFCYCQRNVLQLYIYTYVQYNKTQQAQGWIIFNKKIMMSYAFRVNIRSIALFCRCGRRGGQTCFDASWPVNAHRIFYFNLLFIVWYFWLPSDFPAFPWNTKVRARSCPQQEMRIPPEFHHITVM